MTIMKRTERLALAVVLAIVIGLPAAVFSYQRLYRPATRAGEIFLRARTAEGGGFDPARIFTSRVGGARTRPGSPCSCSAPRSPTP